MLRIATILTALLSLHVAATAADPPPEQLKVPPRALDAFKLPPGAVIVVGSDAKNALQNVEAVVLSPEEYKKLLDTVEQLKKQLNPDKPEIPSVCRLSGKVETRGQQDVARIRAVFEFRTATAKAVVYLACRKAGAVAATLDDGRLPALQTGDDGYSVVIDAPGQHKLTLDLELPLLARGVKGGERGFVLYLPGSPITLIDPLELPAGVTVARLGRVLPAAAGPGGPLAPLPLPLPAKGQMAVALGPVEALELFWDVPAPQKTADPLLAADGVITVRVEETFVATTAKLTLQCRTGRVVDWKVQAPPGAELSLEGSAGDLTVTPAEDKSTWRIRAKEPGVDSLRLEMQSRTPRTAAPVAVGPYLLVGAVSQQGAIRITAPSQLRPRVSKVRSDLSRRESDADGQIAFGYGAIAPPSGAASAPWLYVDAEKASGIVRTQVAHQLSLEETGWRVTTEIKATPIRTEMELLDVDIPAQWRDVQAAPPELVESLVPRRDLGPTRWQIRLAQPRRSDSTLKLEGFYPAPPLPPGTREPAPRELAVPLPRLVGTFDRDGRVSVTVPQGIDVRGTLHEWEHDRIGERGRPLEPQAGGTSFGLASERTPARVDLTWGPVRVELPIDAVIDLTLDETSVQARHRLTLPPALAPRRIVLRSVPGLPPSSIRVLEGGSLAAQGGDWVLTLPATPGRDQTAVLVYTCPLAVKETAATGRTVEPGLLWPAGATRCETRLRIWSRATLISQRPTLADGPWEELPPEAAPERDSLPALVLHGSGISLPLTLQLSEATGLAPHGLAAERILVQVDVFDDGQQALETKIWLRRLSAAWLDVELPAPPGALALLQIKLGDKRFDQIQVVDEAGNAVAGGAGRIVRLPLQALPEGQARELTIAYRRQAGSGLVPWEWSFAPPKLRGAVFIGVVRWQIQLPGEGVILSRDPGAVLEQRWGWRRFLPALRPARNRTEMLQWLRAGQTPEPSPDDDDADLAASDASAVVRTADLTPIRLVSVPRWAWLLACSLFVLGVGLALFGVRRGRFLFRAGLLALPLIAGAAAVLWPQPFAAFLAATPPGLLVLTAVLTLAWLLHRRYQRRVVFMPGFSRAKPATSQTRAAGSSLRRREPATVEAPAEG